MRPHRDIQTLVNEAHMNLAAAREYARLEDWDNWLACLVTAKRLLERINL